MNGSSHRQRPWTRPPRAAQRGVVAILVGLSMVAMVGAVGLALDGGHLYLTKTELQNSADACALAASYELTGAGALNRAEAAGKLVGTQNRVGFQSAAIAASDIDVQFSLSIASGSSWLGAASASPNSMFARCTIRQTGIAPWFMQVMGFGPQTVSALATATLAPAQTNCAVPMAFCVLPGGTAPDFGYVVGDWYGMDFKDTGGAANYTGNFRWIDFDPSASTPGCSGGGAQELACILSGTGQCSLPPPKSGGCSSSGSASPSPSCVGQNGAINSLEQAFNTRFGMYKGSYSSTSSPPDYTGYSYRASNWPAGRDAYAGTGPIDNFKTARAAHRPLQAAFEQPGYRSIDPTDYTARGADRRLVVMPIVDCSSFVGAQHAPIRAYACVLLVDPYEKAPGNDIISRLEYLGRSDLAGSPCASSGVPGNSGSVGPRVPALVQ